MQNEKLTLSDLKMIRQAIRNHWPVPQATRERLAATVASQDLETARPRLKRSLLETAAMMMNAS